MKWVVLMYLFIIGLLIANLSFGNTKVLQEDIKRSSNYGHADTLRNDIEHGLLLKRTDEAINNLLSTAVGELKQRGFQSLADSIMADWNSRYRGFILEADMYQAMGRNIGDHPGIQWMLTVHSKIESAIGVELCHTLRLHDIWTLAHVIPVVIHCVDNVDLVEYSLHFIPFVGILGYWISVGVCMGATLGTAGIGLGCSLIGMAVERILERFIAPPLAIKIHPRVCGG